MDEGDQAGQGLAAISELSERAARCPLYVNGSRRVRGAITQVKSICRRRWSFLACRVPDRSVYPKLLQDRQIRYPSGVRTASGRN